MLFAMKQLFGMDYPKRLCNAHFFRLKAKNFILKTDILWFLNIKNSQIQHSIAKPWSPETVCARKG